jgi:hypothetical protein
MDIKWLVGRAKHQNLFSIWLPLCTLGDGIPFLRHKKKLFPQSHLVSLFFPGGLFFPSHFLLHGGRIEFHGPHEVPLKIQLILGEQ